MDMIRLGLLGASEAAFDEGVCDARVLLNIEVGTIAYYVHIIRFARSVSKPVQMSFRTFVLLHSFFAFFSTLSPCSYHFGHHGATTSTHHHACSFICRSKGCARDTTDWFSVHREARVRKQSKRRNF